MLKSVSVDKLDPSIGVEPTRFAFVARSPNSLGPTGFGPPPWCRTRPLQPVRPLSRVYKAQPLAGAMEEIGSRGQSRTGYRLAYETSNLPLIYPAIKWCPR